MNIKNMFYILNSIIKDKVLIVKSSYNLVVQDKCTYFIQANSSNKKIIAILVYDNEEKSMINFIDISSGKQLETGMTVVCDNTDKQANKVKEVA